MRSDGRLAVLLAKWPRAGRAKRRLARAIGTRPALRLARAFLEDTLSLIERSDADRVLVAFAPPGSRSLFAELADVTLVPQPRASFGTRLRGALEAGLARGYRVIVVGMDSPTLPRSVLRAAFARLDAHDCVVGPATDGGYYLIGARGPLPASLFRGMPWSTSRVAAETIRRAAAAGLEVAVLPSWYDVDDGAGLRRLLRDGAGLRRAPATRAALVDLGLLR